MTPTHIAKLKTKDRWIDGFYCNRKETTYCFTEDYEKYPVQTLHYIIRDEMTDWGLPNELRAYEIDPDTLCRYTGMTDKKGKLIYEHDIVKAYSEGHCATGEVVQRVDGLWIMYPAYQNEEFWGLCPNPDGTTTVEVIGNAIDNPELIVKPWKSFQ